MYVPIKRLLAAADMTAYQLALEFRARGISETVAYRLTKADGHLSRFDAKILDALADILDVAPSELLERDKPKRQ